MRKWKKALKEVTIDKKRHGSRHEREISEQIDIVLTRDGKKLRTSKVADVLVAGLEPTTTLFTNRLKEAAAAGTSEAEEADEARVNGDVVSRRISNEELSFRLTRRQDVQTAAFSPFSSATAETASELFAIATASGRKPPSHETDVDLTAASYLLRAASKPSDIPLVPHYKYGTQEDFNTSSPHLNRRCPSIPPIRTTLIRFNKSTHENLYYHLHNISMKRNPAAKSIAPFLEMRYAIIPIDLALIADIDPITRASNMSTLLDLSKIIARVCSRYRYHFTIFLPFINIEVLKESLATITQPNHTDDDHDTTIPASPLQSDCTLCITNQYLSRIFPDFSPDDLQLVPSLQLGSHPLPPPSLVITRYITYRFVCMHGNLDMVGVHATNVSLDSNTSLLGFRNMMNDVILTQLCAPYGPW